MGLSGGKTGRMGALQGTYGSTKEHVTEEAHQISDGEDSALPGATGMVMRKV
jgi:hypothetical protein